MPAPPRRTAAVMLAEPSPTPLDLRFRLFGTPVSVHPFFWLMAVLLGWRLTSISLVGDNGMIALLLWIVCVFVSILLNEFGHIWMGKAFGTDGYIVMHGMGGLAIGSNQLYTPWKRICVSAAGPAIQLALWGVLYGLLHGGAFASFRVVAATPDSVDNILFPVRRAVDLQGQGGSPVPF